MNTQTRSSILDRIDMLALITIAAFIGIAAFFPALTSICSPFLVFALVWSAGRIGLIVLLRQTPRSTAQKIDEPDDIEFGEDPSDAWYVIERVAHQHGR